MTVNFLKKVVEKKITEDVHHAFSRYSIGEFKKEQFVVKVGKKDWKIEAGFEHLNFLHLFLSEHLTGTVHVEGVIETVRSISEILDSLQIGFSSDKRFGKPGEKYSISEDIPAPSYKKLVTTLSTEYLLFGVTFSDGLMKVKGKSTPKLGSPTEKFVTIKLPLALTKAFSEEYLFDVPTGFKECIVQHTYIIDKIDVDEKLLAKDATAARKQATRAGTITRTIMVDGSEIKKTKFNFKA